MGRFDTLSNFCAAVPNPCPLVPFEPGGSDHFDSLSYILTGGPHIWP